MRELTLIGLDVDGKHIICEGGDPADKFLIRLDERLLAAVRGERARPTQDARVNEVRGTLRPKEIQARIRAGQSVEEIAQSSGMDVAKIDRFAHPVLLERQRAAELATAAHPVLADGPAVATLLETITTALNNRSLDSENTTWDAWRGEDGRWTVRMGWQAGLSENVAHFRFSPGPHGGTVTAIDEAASELIDPEFERPLRQVALVPQLAFEEPAPVVAPVVVAPVVVPVPAPKPVAQVPVAQIPAVQVPVAQAPVAQVPVAQAPAQVPVAQTPVATPPVPAPQPVAQPAAQAPQPPKPQPRPASAKRTGRRPAVPAWEDVLLGVRTSGER